MNKPTENTSSSDIPSDRPCPRLQGFVEQAAKLDPLTVAVVNAEEHDVLQGIMEAQAAGLVKPLLIGRREKIQRLCQQLEYNIETIPVLDADTEDSAAQIGIDLVKQNKASALAKGWIHTDALMRPALKQLGTGRRVSHVFVAELPNYPKLLFITDAAINIEPDLSIKVAILKNAIYLARTLCIERPKVAVLSAVEVVKPGIQSTIDAACLSKMADRGQIKHAIVDGPLAFDNAISSQAAAIKQINSPVAGDVDILLAPDLNSANILAKNLEYLSGATLAGIVIGAQVPILLPSRSDPPQARLVAAALAVLMHHRQSSQENKAEN